MEVAWLHLIPLLPLAGALVCGLFGKWLPKPWLYAVALVTVLLSFLIGLSGFSRLSEEVTVFHELAFNWFSAGALRVDMGFQLDRLSGAPPGWGVYFDCVSRGSNLYGVGGLDLGLIEKSLGAFPLLSLRTSFELGPSGRSTAVHLFTGVLALADR